MRYMKLFVSLAALCLLAGFALAAQNGNGPSASTGCSNENCINSCENQGTCSQENCQAGACQGQNCKVAGTQNGKAQGDQDGSGPLRDRDRDGTCQD